MAVEPSEIRSLIDQEFEEYDNHELFVYLLDALAPYGFHADIWGNDACPKLTLQQGGPHLSVWVDWRDPSCRDVPSGPMLLISRYDSTDGEWEQDIWQADDPDSAEACAVFIRNHIQAPAG